MKKVLITGGNKGIGLEITKLFLAHKFEVIVVARDFLDFPNELRDSIKTVQFDLKEIEKVPQFISDVGDIDILINNAGLMNAFPFDNYPDDKIQEIIRVNLETPVKLITEFSKSMVTKGQGRIVSVASIAGEIGHPDIWYGITKAGVINYTKSFAKILGPKGIVINCVAPSAVETDMLNVIPEERKNAFLQSSVLKRFAKPDEIAKAVYWLGTDSPEYINGLCVDINNASFLR